MAGRRSCQRRPRPLGILPNYHRDTSKEESKVSGEFGGQGIQVLNNIGLVNGNYSLENFFQVSNQLVRCLLEVKKRIWLNI